MNRFPQFLHTFCFLLFANLRTKSLKILNIRVSA
nr:MAG TPA: hypothetical protein [Bacteriophage sp.]